MIEAVLRGEPGIRRDVVLLNAGAALLVAGVVGQMEEGIDAAALTIDAGLGDRAARGPAGRAARAARPPRRAGVTVADRRDPTARRRTARPAPTSSPRSPSGVGPTSAPSSRRPVRRP